MILLTRNNGNVSQLLLQGPEIGSGGLLNIVRTFNKEPQLSESSVAYTVDMFSY